jgi:hypothetical protein
MVGIYRFGKTQIGVSDGVVPVGSASNSFFLSPSRVFAYSSSERDSKEGNGAKSLVITGTNADNERVSEVLVLAGENNRMSENSFIFIDEVLVNEGSNVGIITLKTDVGQVVGHMEVGENQLSKANYHVFAENTAITGYGGSVRHYAEGLPVVVSLVEYANGRRRVLHSMAIDSRTSALREKLFENEYQVGVGSVIALEAETEGSPVTLYGWLELIKYEELFIEEEDGDLL